MSFDQGKLFKLYEQKRIQTRLNETKINIMIGEDLKNCAYAKQVSVEDIKDSLRYKDPNLDLSKFTDFVEAGYVKDKINGGVIFGLSDGGWVKLGNLHMGAPTKLDSIGKDKPVNSVTFLDLLNKYLHELYDIMFIQPRDRRELVRGDRQI